MMGPLGRRGAATQALGRPKSGGTEGTMPELMDVITQAIGGDTMKQMSRQLGTSEQSTGCSRRWPGTRAALRGRVPCTRR